MTGVDLAKALAAEYPDIPALIVSGYAEAKGAAQGFPDWPSRFDATG
jgi:YesN/AraC family two-component response regulator